ncbi:MAG: excinuclease ABC subunit UvrC [Methyloversatilis sp.]|uniref:UvrABC system protein C n=2 Tax=Pseudomonadota TaxID=1224 RepID=F5R8S4_METUF|nr:excinuclease ABC subunit UvrC [Methyloversatilis universalis]EGK72814.1 UvrABC system protein C [Methyloversatilis universalis FAM5]MCP4634910.1 excinuclease ABC subunit UvrC [Methyloversatilis sp.]
MSFDAKAFLPTVPEDPGVYRMIGSEDEVLYVGKAKNLRRRVSSYFQRTPSSPRIGMMVSQVVRVDLTVVRSEAEALILENNLIKSLRPKYNILFRDDKSYPYIKLSNDRFARIGFFRGTVGRDARYFGPLPNAWAVRETIQLVQRVFLLRTCENSVFSNRSRPCLLHQIHRCSAPCVDLVSKEDYDEDVRMAALFLNGRHGEVIDRLSEQMNAAAEALAFEKAAQIRDQIRALSKVLHKQYADSARDEDLDIVVAIERDGSACVNHAMVRGGRHLGDHAHFPAAGQGSAADMLLAFVTQHYAAGNAPKRIVVNALPEADEGEAPLPGSTLALARNERERAWTDMALKNAEIALGVKLDAGARASHRVRALVEALELDVAPERIECFDISHTMGEATVASCVVWMGGAMRNSEYRRYNIDGITPGDDYAAMRQVLTRRYEKVASGEGARPDLVLIDGGRGQLGIAIEVMAELGLDLPLVGVAKGEERKMGAEELIRPGIDQALVLGPEHPALHLIAEIRDEAHRFAIAGHRAKRAKKRLTSTLEDIPGIGPARRKRLLTTFGGLAGVRNATVEDLCRVDGISRTLAEQIHRQLN